MVLSQRIPHAHCRHQQVPNARVTSKPNRANAIGQPKLFQISKTLYAYKEKERKSQSKHSFIGVQTSYMFRLYIAIITLKTEL